MITIQREDKQKQGRYFDGRKYILVLRIEGYTMSGDFTQASLVQDHNLIEALKRAGNGVQTPKSEEGAAGTLPGKVTDGNAHVIGLTIGYKF